MSQYFPKPYEPFGGDINVNVDLSNYATKADLKNITHVDVSSFALESNLTTLKTKAHKLDIDKLTPVPNDLAKLSNVVKNDVVKKTVYDKLFTKVKKIDADKKISDTSDLAKKTDLNSKITEIEGKIASITGLAITLALTAVENKIPDVSGLVTKTDYNIKIS